MNYMSIYILTFYYKLHVLTLIELSGLWHDILQYFADLNTIEILALKSSLQGQKTLQYFFLYNMFCSMVISF